MRRRALLAAVATATSATAGCLGSLDSTGADATGSTTTGPPTTDATEPCSVDDALDLPDVEVPANPTEGAAREVAAFVETAYARDRAEAEGWTVSGVDYTNTEPVQDGSDAGVHVHVEVSLDAAESAERAGDGETTLLADLYYAAWYRVTATRVQRSGVDGEAPPQYGWATVACR